MKPFSIFELEKLDSNSKKCFFQESSELLCRYIDEIRNDDVLNVESIANLINNKGVVDDSFETISELYHNATAGIQAGSGNQDLYIALVACMANAWEKISK